VGHARLGEAKAARAARVRPGQADDVVEALGEALRLVERARPRDGVDRPPLPGDPADDAARAQPLGQVGGGQRADDVSAAADADAENPRGAAQEAVDRPTPRRARQRNRRSP
jgi:hypothetical protein